MKINVLSVGKPRDKLLLELQDRYLSRLKRMVEVSVSHVPETVGRGMSAAEVRHRDAERLRAALARGKETRRSVVVLDELGKQPDTRVFADQLRDQQEQGTQLLVFIVGGHHGLDPQFVKEADRCIALSKLTFTHEFALAILAEQLYRAHCLLAGHPYHRA